MKAGGLTLTMVLMGLGRILGVGALSTKDLGSTVGSTGMECKHIRREISTTADGRTGSGTVMGN